MKICPGSGVPIFVLIFVLTSEKDSGSMAIMNENVAEIQLRDFMARDDGWGHEEGHKVLLALLKAVEAQPTIKIFRISLEGVKRTDASFPRESVLELARRYRGKKGFCLIHFTNKDLLDNWDAAALKKDQPLIVWKNDKYELIGPPPSLGNKDIFEFALAVPLLTASTAAKSLDLKITNASTKLKLLEEQGYLLRKEEVSPTGGKEFAYFRIK